MITCPICGLTFKSITHKHAKKHGLQVPDFHKLRIEAQFNQPLYDILNQLYIQQELSTPEVGKRLGVTFRTLRDLLKMCGLSVRSISEGVAVTWIGDTNRKEQQSRYLKGVMADRLSHGLVSRPSPEARKRVSILRKTHNPGLRGMHEAMRQKRLAHPTNLESPMICALQEHHIPFEREYPALNYFLDFAIPQLKIGIECDGGWHDDPIHAARDIRRDETLRAEGWTIIRYKRSQILKSVSDCVDDLLQRIHQLG